MNSPQTIRSRRNPARRQRIFSFDHLENRVLFAQILASAYGAVANDGRDDRAAVQAAINAASAGDTVAFGDGTFHLNATINLKSGVNLSAISGAQPNLIFSVTKDGNGYAFRGSNVSNIAVMNLKIRSNNGIFRLDNTSNLTFTGNDFVWGYDGVYYNRLAFTGSKHDRLRIEGNYFHDSPTSDRNVELFGMSNSSYSYNGFYNINDGGHIMNPGDNVRYSFNYGRLIHRMGIEVQQTSYPPATWPKNFVVEGNVFYDWNKPYWDSMGLSVPVAGIAVTIRNNYIRQNAYNGVWGDADSSGNVRGSYGIEGPQGPPGEPGGLIDGNIIGSERSVMAIAAPGQNTVAMNNRLFGTFSWGAIGGEPGALGWGTVIESNNVHDLRAGVIPAPPPIKTLAGLKPIAIPIPDPPPGPAPAPAPQLPSPPQPWDESRFIYLNRFAWTTATNGAGPVEFNMSNGAAQERDGAMLSLDGVAYDYGLGVAGDSEIVYQLNRQFARFTANVGVDDESPNNAALRFQVWGDGRMLFDSGTVRGRDRAKSIDLNTTGVRELKLITLPGITNGRELMAHGDWVDAKLFIDPDAVPEPTVE